MAAVMDPDMRHRRNPTGKAQEVLPGSTVLIRNEESLAGCVTLGFTEVFKNAASSCSKLALCVLLVERRNFYKFLLFLAASRRTIWQFGAASQLVACCGHGEEKGIAQKQGPAEGQRPSLLFPGRGLPGGGHSHRGAQTLLPPPHQASQWQVSGIAWQGTAPPQK